MALTAISPYLAAGIGFVALLGFLISPLVSWNRKIPGPLLAKYTSLWYMWQVCRNDFHWTNIKLHRKKGRIVQITPGYFTIDDPEAHKVIYTHGTSWIKSESYTAWNIGPDPSLTNLFTERGPARHAVMRRNVSSMYSMTSMVSYEPYVDHCIELFHNQLDHFASVNSVVNLGRWLQYFAFDAVSMITFGERIGFLDHGEDIENLIKDLNHVHILLNGLGVYPWLTPAFKMVNGLFSGSKVPFFQRFATAKIETTRNEKQDLREDGPIYMVKKFIHAQRKDDNKKITDWDVSANAGANIGAGSDTTAMALGTIIYYLYRDRRVLERVRKEIESADLSSRPTFQDAQKMPYLQAVIKEAFRVQPAVGIPLWREVPKGGAVVCGQFFPEGTNLGVNPWVSHHNKEIYGPDADEFRPERWLEAGTGSSGRESNAMEQSLVPFGFGSRTCIGKNISLLEINKIVPVLVRDFDFLFLDKDGLPETRHYIPVRNDWFMKLPHLYGKVVRRSNSTV